MEKTVGKLKNMEIGDKVMKCRNCYIEDDHWTSKCPLKLQNTVSKSMESRIPEWVETKGTKYVSRTISETSIKISNLPKCATNAYLQELAKPFGKIKRVCMAKYKDTNLCKGHAFINFKTRSQAAKAIEELNGHKYGNLILNVDWSDSPARNN